MNYNTFRSTDNHAYNISQAIEYCKHNNIQSLEFDKGVYDIYPDMASEGIYCTSNHGVNGYKRIAFLLKDMHDFTIDGNGSEFVFHGIISPFVVDNCSNITLKNFSLYTPKAFSNTAELVNVGEDCFDVKLPDGQDYFVLGDQLFFGDALKNYPVAFILEAESNKKHLRKGMGDYILRPQDKVYEIEKGIIRFQGLNRPLPIMGNRIILMCRARDAACIMMQKSRNIKIENYTAFSGIGMGVIAQKCENIEISKMHTKCKEDRYISLNADATHFVHCKGTVKVTDSTFEGQLDDALNVHGIYTRIVNKWEDKILVKYMHHQAKGLDIYESGSKIQIVDPYTLLPKDEFEILKVSALNADCTLLTLNKTTDKINIGDDVEDIFWSPDVYFERNSVTFNRARGILLGARGKTVILDNYFNTAGGAILFESNGDFWFESGAVKDVIIKNNVFDDCRYGKWCNAVISMVPRKETENGRFFHGNVSVESNTFKNCESMLFYADNAENICFKNNELINCGTTQPFVANHCKTVSSDH